MSYAILKYLCNRRCHAHTYTHTNLLNSNLDNCRYQLDPFECMELSFNFNIQIIDYSMGVSGQNAIYDVIRN